MPQDIEIKVILLGDSAVGKTSILTRIIQNTFSEDPASTIGATYSFKKIRYENYDVQMQIWDTAGQERYRCLAPIYYRGTNIVFLVYSIDDRNSFSVIDFWTKSLIDNSAVPALKFLIANKTDIKEGDLISSSEGAQKAKEIGAEYYEVSAKTGDGINDLLNTCAQMYIEKLNHGTVIRKLEGPSKQDEGGKKCCS